MNGCKTRLQTRMTNRLVAAVAALIAEGSLVDVHKPAMPRHKVAREVQRQGLVDVDSHKVVKLSRRMCQSLQLE